MLEDIVMIDTNFKFSSLYQQTDFKNNYTRDRREPDKFRRYRKELYIKTMNYFKSRSIKSSLSDRDTFIYINEILDDELLVDKINILLKNIFKNKYSYCEEGYSSYYINTEEYFMKFEFSYFDSYNGRMSLTLLHGYGDELYSKYTLINLLDITTDTIIKKVNNSSIVLQSFKIYDSNKKRIRDYFEKDKYYKYLPDSELNKQEKKYNKKQMMRILDYERQHLSHTLSYYDNNNTIEITFYKKYVNEM
jgi:hypothetical protein